MNGSWKTTSSGIALLLVQLGNAIDSIVKGQPVNILELITAIVAAVGLIMAKDHNVTGGNVRLAEKK